MSRHLIIWLGGMRLPHCLLSASLYLAPLYRAGCAVVVHESAWQSVLAGRFPMCGDGGSRGAVRNLCAATDACPVAPSRTRLLFLSGRWEWEDLEPYVQDLRGPGQTAEALLLKYTRASQAKPTDPVTYSMR